MRNAVGRRGIMTAARCKEAVVGKDGFGEEAWEEEGIVMGVACRGTAL